MGINFIVERRIIGGAIKDLKINNVETTNMTNKGYIEKYLLNLESNKNIELYCCLRQP